MLKIKIIETKIKSIKLIIFESTIFKTFLSELLSKKLMLFLTINL